MLLNCGVGEDSWGSLGLQGDPTSPTKGDQSWVFIGRTDVEAETPILWPPDAKNWLIGKDPDSGKDWGQEEKGMTEDEMVGWHYRLNGHGFGWTPGVGDGQGGLMCYSSWGCRVRHDWASELNWMFFFISSNFLCSGIYFNINIVTSAFEKHTICCIYFSILLLSTYLCGCIWSDSLTDRIWFD